MGRFGAKRARTQTGDVPSSSINATQGEDTQPTSAFDVDLLDCHICMNPLTSPIYQCLRGHILCSECWGKLDLCPSCSGKIGKARCLALEKLIESLSMKCKYAGEGCNRMVKYTLKKSHEEACGYSPVKCPVPSCTFAGARDSIWEHLRAAHQIRTMDIKYDYKSEVRLLELEDSSIMLREKDAFFLFHQVHNELWLPGGAGCYHVTRFGSLLAEKEVYHNYELEIRVGTLPFGQTKYTMETTCCSTGLEGRVRKPKKLLVCSEGCESMSVFITIRRGRPSVSTSVEDGSFPFK